LDLFLVSLSGFFLPFPYFLFQFENPHNGKLIIQQNKKSKTLPQNNRIFVLLCRKIKNPSKKLPKNTPTFSEVSEFFSFVFLLTKNLRIP